MMTLRTRYFFRLLLLSFLTAALGIFSRLFPVGSYLWDKYLGDALYASFFYFALSLIWRYKAFKLKGILTAIYVVSIEVFQLTGIPLKLHYSKNWLVVGFVNIVLGSEFMSLDLLAYAVGILFALSMDRFYLGKSPIASLLYLYDTPCNRSTSQR